MRLFYCDQYEIPLPAGHKFPMQKYRLLRERIIADGFWHLEPAALASPETIAMAHDPEYVRQFIDGTLPAAVMRRIGFPWSQGLVTRTLGIGGEARSRLRATRWIRASEARWPEARIMRFDPKGRDFACSTTSRLRSARCGSARAAVVDLDVHQGDGTAHFFQEDPAVLTLSMHGAHNFPFRKQRSTIDVELPDGTGDAEYLQALDSVLPRVFEFRPDIVFYLSGVDALASDVLGRLSLTHEGLKARR